MDDNNVKFNRALQIYEDALLQKVYLLTNCLALGKYSMLSEKLARKVILAAIETETQYMNKNFKRKFGKFFLSKIYL